LDLQLRVDAPDFRHGPDSFPDPIRICQIPHPPFEGDNPIIGIDLNIVIVDDIGSGDPGPYLGGKYQIIEPLS
jgi:hypothetical protein